MTGKVEARSVYEILRGDQLERLKWGAIAQGF